MTEDVIDVPAANRLKYIGLRNELPTHRPPYVVQAMGRQQAGGCDVETLTAFRRDCRVLLSSPLRLRVILQEHAEQRRARRQPVEDRVEHARRRVDLVDRRLEVVVLGVARRPLARVLVVDPAGVDGGDVDPQLRRELGRRRARPC